MTLECLADLPRIFPTEEVDPVWLNRADPLLLGQVASHRQLLFGPERAFNELESEDKHPASRGLLRCLSTDFWSNGRSPSFLMTWSESENWLTSYLADDVNEVLAERYLERRGKRVLPRRVRFLSPWLQHDVEHSRRRALARENLCLDGEEAVGGNPHVDVGRPAGGSRRERA